MRDKLNDIAIILVNIVAIAMLSVLLVLLYNAIFLKPEKNESDLPKLPNYDKEALLDLMEKGECVGGTIHEGKFSVFVCKN